MGLKSIFSAIKNEGYVIKPLDFYLLGLDAKDSDRAIDVNAPSAVGQCLRARYYTRTGATCDTCSVSARTRRIFDNGTGVHERLQSYLKKQGMLLMDEVPIINDEYNIQGHTDGILKLSDKELGVLEIKSINSKGFSELKTAKPEHQRQGLVYLYCLETQRQYLRNRYDTEERFSLSILARRRRYAKRYQHLKDGSKYTAKEKIMFQADLCSSRDMLLYHCETPITKVIFLYENKDTQDLKEFCISSEDVRSNEIMKEVLEEMSYLNEAVSSGEIPERCASSKNDNACRWCNYKTECWN